MAGIEQIFLRKGNENDQNDIRIYALSFYLLKKGRQHKSALFIAHLNHTR